MSCRFAWFVVILNKNFERVLGDSYEKENLHIRAIRYFYDIVGELDEVSYATLTNFGNNMYMLFMTVTLVSF